MTWATIGLGIASIASGVIANLIEINPIFALSCYWFGALLVLFAGFFSRKRLHIGACRRPLIYNHHRSAPRVFRIV